MGSIESVLLNEPSIEYQLEPHNRSSYVQVIVPPASEPDAVSIVAFTIGDAVDGTLSWVRLSSHLMLCLAWAWLGPSIDTTDVRVSAQLSLVSFSDNASCVFGPPAQYPSFPINTTAPSTTFNVTLGAGLWTVLLVNEAPLATSIQVSYSVVGEVVIDNEPDKGFWSKRNIIIVLVAAAVAVVLVCAAIGGGWYWFNQRHKQYESI